MAICGWCGHDLPNTRTRRKWCNDTCKMRAYRYRCNVTKVTMQQMLEVTHQEVIEQRKEIAALRTDLVNLLTAQPRQLPLFSIPEPDRALDDTAPVISVLPALEIIESDADSFDNLMASVAAFR